MDWSFVRWLLENGADPAANPHTTWPMELMYSIGVGSAEVNGLYQSLVKKFEEEKESGAAVLNQES